MDVAYEGRLRILFIVETIPSRADQGSSIRSGNLVRGLAVRHQVTVVGYAPPSDVATTPIALGNATVRAVDSPPRQSRSRSGPHTAWLSGA